MDHYASKKDSDPAERDEDPPLWVVRSIHIIFTILDVLYKVVYVMFVHVFFVYGKALGKPLLRFLALPLYQRFLKISKYYQHFFRSHRAHRVSKFIFLGTSKYAWHAVAGLIILGVSTNNVITRAGTNENFGQHTLFVRLTKPTGDFITLIQEDAVDQAALTTTQKVQYDKLFASLSTPALLHEWESADQGTEAALTKGGIALITPQIQETASTPVPRKTVITYLVEPGDTISAISEKFDISVNTILWTNNKTSRSIIRPGDKLAILPVSGILHTVQKNETLSSISKKYNIPIQDIESFNEDTRILAVGMSILIPGGKKPYIPPPHRPIFSPIQTALGRSSTSGDTMFWPATCRRITQYFKGYLHTGLDVACPKNSAIYAAEDGVVEKAGWGRGYGNMVIINHGGGVRTLYGHIVTGGILVSVGDRVSKGENIARVGSTGRSTGPHVHFEVIISGGKRNPLNYL